MTFDELLVVFFGDENHIQPTGDRPGFVPESIWIGDPFDERCSPIALPRLKPSGALVWYVLAFDDESFSALRPQLLASVGLSYSDFGAGTAQHRIGDGVDDAVDRFTGGRYYALTVGPTARQRQAMARALSTLWALREESPVASTSLPRPVGRILKEFEWALRSAESERSYELLEELKNSGGLGALNLAYLGVQRLAALHRWVEMLDHPDLDFVMQARRPRRVTEAISDALYHVWFQPFDRAIDPTGAIALFNERVADRYAPLFRNVAGLTTATSLVPFSLWAVSGPQRPLAIEQILGQVGTGEAAGPFLLSIAELVEAVPGVSGDGVLEKAQSAAEEGAFARSLDLLRTTSDGVPFVRLALWTGYELGDVASAEFALEWYDRLPLEEQGLLRRSRNVTSQLESLRALLVGPISWSTWLEMLNSSDVLGDAVERAIRGVDEWDPGEFVAQGERIVGMMSEERSVEGQVALQNSLPSILQALSRSGASAAHPRVRELLEAVFYQLALADQRSSGDLEVILDIVSITLDAGLDPSAYRSLLDALLEIWGEEESARRMPWFVDLGEAVEGYPAVDHSARQRFASVLVSAIARYGDSLSLAQRQVAHALAGDLGVGIGEALGDVELPAVELETESTAPLPETVGIYTLVPGVGERVKGIIEARFPGVRVQHSDDHVASQGLLALARNSSVLLIASRAAKHAATTYLERERPEGLPILYPPGKGSSSMISEFEAFVSA